MDHMIRLAIRINHVLHCSILKNWLHDLTHNKIKSCNQLLCSKISHMISDNKIKLCDPLFELNNGSHNLTRNKIKSCNPLFELKLDHIICS